jgi:hypothetical protein
LANFQGKGIAVPFGARAVYGFDIAVDGGLVFAWRLIA